MLICFFRRSDMFLNIKHRLAGGLAVASVYLLLSPLSSPASPIPSQDEGKISRFGEYKGYSEPAYDSWVRTSQYLTMRDGVRIAIDVIRPARGGKVAEERLPVIWSHNRYRRASLSDGKIFSVVDSPLYQSFIRFGYILANADVRGSGASFGTWTGIFTPEESRDAYEITEWLASQPWCDGNVGMFGGSYLGVTQLMAASTRPHHLKAIFPVVALFDIYGVAYHNGVFFDDLIRTWSDLTMELDKTPGVAPVDGEDGESLLRAALEEHAGNRRLIDIFASLRFRDSRDETTGARPYCDWQPAGFIKEINESGIPMYVWGGWFDSFTKDCTLIYRNFAVPKRLVMGAWSHSPRDPEIGREEYTLAITEALRWFDRWLKGITNGIMDEPPVQFQLMKGPKQNEWRTAMEWPVADAVQVPYYFGGGPSGSIASVNDGELGTTPPTDNAGRDEYQTDYTTTSGKTSRWDNAVGGGFGYGDMTENDRKGLTYTTPPLVEDLDVSGHPVAHLWVSSPAEDGDFFLYLEEVDAQGVSHYVSEGAIKASHRVLNEPYYDNLGLPFHRSYAEDAQPLKPGKATELVFDLQPTANLFKAGNRVRITVVGADVDNALPLSQDPPPTVTIYRGKKMASYISLPVVGGKAMGTAKPGEQVVREAGFSLTLALLMIGIIILVIILTIWMRSRLRKK
jgi:putative CocE/NonD family hydrolase